MIDSWFLELGKLTWNGTEKALKETDFVFFPLRCSENQSLHLFLDLDLTVAYAFVKRVAKRFILILKFCLLPYRYMVGAREYCAALRIHDYPHPF